MNKKILVFLAVFLLALRVALAQQERKSLLLDNFQGDVAQGQTIPIQASDKIRWDSYGAISFWLKGAASGIPIALDIEDADGEIHRCMVKDDASERKQIICPFNQFFPRSYGQPFMVEPDGEIDFPIKSLRFEPVSAAQGPILIDTVSLEALN